MRNKGITLVALVITIIVLLILAGVAISLTIGEHGILNMAKLSKEQTEKAEIQQEIEFAIMEIQAESITNDKEFTMDLLQVELSKKLTNITAEKDEEGQIIGEYKGYDFIINKEYKVSIEKVKGKPSVDYTLSDDTIGIEEVTIILTATPNKGTITKIIKPNGDYEENVTEVQYTVTKNGKYKFIVEASNGTKTTKIVHITNLKPTAPVIDAEAIYPTLTAYGIERPKVKIIYEENENLEHYYSEDGGATWQEYIGEFTASGSKILAKSVVKEHEDCYTQVELNVVSSDDALGIEGYDGNDETYVQLKGNRAN